MTDYNPVEPNNKQHRLSKREKRLRRQMNSYHDESVHGINLIGMEPMTINQGIAFDEFEDGSNLLLTGTAGTGKSFLALYLAMKECFKKDSEQKQTIIIRSIVPTRDMGFLPGNIIEKSRIYEAPYQAIFSELFGRGDAYDILKQKRNVVFMPTSHVRGITLKNAIIVIDEIQNMTASELHSVFTRIGVDCRVILAGDIKQNDLKHNKELTGFEDFVKILQQMASFSTVEFTAEDIVRGELVKEYIMIRERMEKDREIDRL